MRKLRTNFRDFTTPITFYSRKVNELNMGMDLAIYASPVTFYASVMIKNPNSTTGQMDTDDIIVSFKIRKTPIVIKSKDVIVYNNERLRIISVNMDAYSMNEILIQAVYDSKLVNVG